MELEFQNYPKFTPEMKKTHKILIPNMAPVQFRILAAVMRQAGYTCELLENCGSQVSELGLKYVHNDTCYPALLVIGQFLDALGSGKYDLDHTALIITQTGGGCRASNYIHLLRKALEKGKVAKGGAAMLVLQAVRAHEIWNDDSYSDAQIESIICDMEELIDEQNAKK